MKTLLIGIAVVIGSLALTSCERVQAKPVQCFLQVNGKVYIDKICNGEFGKDGSFTVGVGETKRNEYFVYMNRNDDGTMDASWNGIEAANHAHEELGTVTQHGACWLNAHAKVCAWKMGESRK